MLQLFTVDFQCLDDVCKDQKALNTAVQALEYLRQAFVRRRAIMYVDNCLRSAWQPQQATAVRLENM